MATKPRHTGGREGLRAIGGITLGNRVYILPPLAGVPVDGASGTGAGYAGPGSQITDYTNAFLYINTNTAASPTWVKVGTQS